jgi:hypothetical protein
MKGYKHLAAWTAGLVFVTGCITYLVAGDSTEYTSSGMVYTDDNSVFWMVALIVGGLLLVIGPICIVISTISNRHQTGANIPKAVSTGLMLVLCGVILLLPAIVLPYQTVATIDVDRNSLRFDDRFLSGKTQISIYSLNEIVNVEWLDDWDSGCECSHNSITIVLNNGERIRSPVSERLFAQKLSEYTGKRLVEIYE